MKKGVLILFLMFQTLLTFSQNDAEVEMADSLKSSGKIYVVVAVLSIIFVGIVIYLILIDRKIFKLEKQFRSKKDGVES